MIIDKAEMTLENQYGCVRQLNISAF